MGIYLITAASKNIYILCGIHIGAMASASASVDSKAELTALLEQWERERLGNAQELDNILTK